MYFAIRQATSNMVIANLTAQFISIDVKTSLNGNWSCDSIFHRQNQCYEDYRSLSFYNPAQVSGYERHQKEQSRSKDVACCGWMEQGQCWWDYFRLLPVFSQTWHSLLLYIWSRIAYNVFNMDRKLRFIAKLPLIIGVFLSWDKNYWSYDVALWL